MIKKISIFRKEEKGNISILVLIIGMAVILLTTVMVGYIFRDIGFTEQDKDKLRALNFAESGISNMYLNIDRYYNEDIPIPSSPITGEIEDNGEIQGSFIVDYEYHNDGGLFYYIITSKGIDKSGAERTVRVKINVIQSSPALDIYDYVYTSQTASFNGDFKPVDGPFYTEGDLNLTQGSAIWQEYNPGPVIIKGNLFMSGGTASINADPLKIGGNAVMMEGAKIIGGQVNIAGNLTMSGGTYIDDDLISPMIVMGNINMSAGTWIGESGKDLILSCHGTIQGSGTIHATVNDNFAYTFDNPSYNVAALIDEYKSDVQSSALTIPGNLVLNDLNVPYNYQRNGNSLSLVKEGGKCILEVHGNVIINGNLQIGKVGSNPWWPLQTDKIYYRGKGVIYASGDIKTFTKLVPLNISNFPEDTLMVFMSNQNIESYVWRDYYPQQYQISCADSCIYMVAIARQNIKIGGDSGEGAIVRGTLIAGGQLDANRHCVRVCYEESISEYLPSELPSSSSGGGDITITKGEWQEVID